MPSLSPAKTTAVALKLSLRADSAGWRTHFSFVRHNLLAAHDILRPALGELSVGFVGDKRMGELHEQFMGILGPTDVLTFPLEADARGKVTEGEVVVCVPEARRRARE